MAAGLFKVLGWLAIIVAVLMCFTIFLIPASIPVFLSGGAFLVISRYLSRKDNQPE
jgi:hypothetical protein